MAGSGRKRVRNGPDGGPAKHPAGHVNDGHTGTRAKKQRREKGPSQAAWQPGSQAARQLRGRRDRRGQNEVGEDRTGAGEEAGGVEEQGAEEAGGLLGEQDGQNEGEENEGKPRIFEIARWALDCIETMLVFSLEGSVGLWQVCETGAARILVKREPPAGAQPSVLLMASDLFRTYGPFVGSMIQMMLSASPGWRWASAQEREAILNYLKTEDHVNKICKWIDDLVGWNHATLRSLRKDVVGGIVVLPGPSGPIALDLRTSPSGDLRTKGLGVGEPLVQWEKLQRLAMPVPDSATDEQVERRKELAFVFEFRHRGVTFQQADFERGAIKAGMEPFTKVLRMLEISDGDQRFLLKWLALLLRREFVPVLMVQSLWLARLLLHTFIPPEAICHVKMHQQLPASGHGAASYLALLCSDMGVTLNTSAPLCGLVNQLGLMQDQYSRGCAQFPGPALVLVCAPNHITALAGGAGTVANAVRFIHSPIMGEGFKEVEDLLSDPASEAPIRKAVVVAVAQGALMLHEDGGRLSFPSSPPLLSQVAPEAGNVRRPKVPFKKGALEYQLLQALEGVKHAAIITYDPSDNSASVDLSMLCTVVFLLERPLDWKVFLRMEERNKNKDMYAGLFDTVAPILAERGGRAKVKRTRMFQPGDRGSPVANRIAALGSSSVYDALSGSTKKEDGEGNGGNRICHISIDGETLESIFLAGTLDRYDVCDTPQCGAGDTSEHLRNLCALKRRLDRRKQMLEDKEKFFQSLIYGLEGRFVVEALGEVPDADAPAGSRVDPLELRVKQLTESILYERNAQVAS